MDNSGTHIRRAAFVCPGVYRSLAGVNMIYKPRRQSKRWLDADCPKGVLAIYDHPHAFDRYTVFYVPAPGDTWISYLAASENPFHPQGFGQHGEVSMVAASITRKSFNRHACKWSQLPENVKRAVEQDLGG